LRPDGILRHSDELLSQAELKAAVVRKADLAHKPADRGFGYIASGCKIPDAHAADLVRAREHRVGHHLQRRLEAAPYYLDAFQKSDLSAHWLIGLSSPLPSAHTIARYENSFQEIFFSRQQIS